MPQTPMCEVLEGDPSRFVTGYEDVLQQFVRFGEMVVVFDISFMIPQKVRLHFPSSPTISLRTFSALR